MNSVIGLSHRETFISTDDPSSKSIIVGTVGRPAIEYPTRLRLEEADISALTQITEIARDRLSDIVQYVLGRFGTRYYFQDGQELVARGRGEIKDFQWWEGNGQKDKQAIHHPIDSIDKTETVRLSSGRDSELSTSYLIWDNGREDAYRLRLNADGINYNFTRCTANHIKDPIRMQVVGEGRVPVEKLMDWTRLLDRDGTSAEIKGDGETANVSDIIRKEHERKARQNHSLTLPLSIANKVVQFAATVLSDGIANLQEQDRLWVPPSFEEWAATEEERQVAAFIERKIQKGEPVTPEIIDSYKAIGREISITRQRYMSALADMGHIEQSLRELLAWDCKTEEEAYYNLEEVRQILWLCGQDQRAREIITIVRSLFGENTTHN